MANSRKAERARRRVAKSSSLQHARDFLQIATLLGWLSPSIGHVSWVEPRLAVSARQLLIGGGGTSSKAGTTMPDKNHK
jgi:hypothetical protein